MRRSTLRRRGALVVSMAMLAGLLLATMAAPATAAGKVTCGGQVATIVGTEKGDVLYGTSGPDIIAGLGGNDVIIGRGGNDLICGGKGADRLVGKKGFDRLYGNAGPDRLFGGDGPDRLFGGAGNDRIAGQTGNDRLNGGAGTDTCYQGQGTGPAVSCELPHTLIPLAGILAVAYSDVDGLDGYSTGDVLIAKLVDTNGDKTPSAGDTVVMGRYPLNLDATAFGNWTVKSHVVAAAVSLTDTSISVTPSAAPAQMIWVRDDLGEHYFEMNSSRRVSDIQEGIPAGGQDDAIRVIADSLSAPQPPVDPEIALDRPGDDVFIDVVLNWAP